MTKLSALDLKDQAKRLRAALATAGNPVSHSEALELVAAQNGYRDWNTASAMAPANSLSAPYQVGDVIAGRYLGQHFTGQIKSVARVGENYRITTVFDAPVDVVTFDSFSNFRSQVTTVMGKNGMSVNTVSDGTPHMAIQN